MEGACAAEEPLQAVEAPVSVPNAADESQQQPASTPKANSTPGFHQLQIYLQMVVQQQDLHPGICRRGERPPAIVGKVADWSSVKKGKHTTSTKKETTQQQRERENPRSRWAQQRAGVHKIAGTAGRTFTSRFRGVHQTFPTKRWEAQFRRNGKPTSLGCFDQEDEAARAYDRMMLWCEIHGAAGSMKGTMTNFDMTEYEKDIAWLTNIAQDDLIEALRSEGRKQAMNRQAAAVNAKRSQSRGRSGGLSDDAGGEATAEGADTTAGPPGTADDDGLDGDAADGAVDGDAAMMEAAAEDDAGAALYDPSSAAPLLHDAQAAAAAAVAAGRHVMDMEMQDADQLHGQLSVTLPCASPAGANVLTSPAAAAAAFLTASPAAALTSASPQALNLLFGSIGQDALAAVQQLQQQLDQAAASGAEPDANAAAAAAFQIGQIAGTNLLAALSSNPSPAAGAAAAGAGVPVPFGLAGSGDAMAAYGMDDASALAAMGGEDMTVGLQEAGGQ